MKTPCPFCRSELEEFKDKFITTHACYDSTCINDDMPRYKEIYENTSESLIERYFMMGGYYIQVSYKNNWTVISRLEACLLFDSVQIPTALKIDLTNPLDILNKVKLFMIFS